MKKITILLPNLREGGVERMRLILARELSKNYQVEFLLINKIGNLLSFVPNDIDVKSLEINNNKNILLSLFRYLRREGPDILLVAMWPLTVIAPIANILQTKKAKCVVSEHGILSHEHRHYATYKKVLVRISMAIGYRLANTVIGVSNGVAKDISQLSFLAPKKVKIINNPAQLTDTNALGLNLSTNSLDIPTIITVGRYKKVKNHFLLIKAFSLLRQKTKARLYIIGDGELKSDYSALIKNLNIEQDVILTGFISNPLPYYLSADLFVLSSDSEGFGNVLVEALSVGIPVISTDCESGPREILDHGKYGKLVPVNDVEALAQAMLESLQQKHNTELLKKRAAEFSVEKITAQYIEAFK